PAVIEVFEEYGCFAVKARGIRGCTTTGERHDYASYCPDDTLHIHLSYDLCPMLPQQLPQYRAMAPLLVLAVAPHREIGPVGERGEEREEPVALGVLHLSAVAADELVPARIGDGLRHQPAHQLGARGEIGDPDVIEI